MAVRRILRAAASDIRDTPVGGPGWNDIHVDSGSDVLVFGTGTSGTTTKTVLDLTSAQTITGVKTFSSPIVAPTSVNVISGLVAGPTAITAAQSGSTFLLDRAAGGELTLPAPAIGLNYNFLVTVSVTSNDYEIATNTPGTDLYIGSLTSVLAAGSTTTQFFPNGTNMSAIVMNGTTTGGLINTQINIVCVNGTTWSVSGTNMASGSFATPFTTT